MIVLFDVVRVERFNMARSVMGPDPRRGKTLVWPASRKPTWFAPKSDPNGRSRPEEWDLFSRDGLWHYARMETGTRSVWHAIYLPTGQWREYGSKNAAREETFAGLAEHLATEAFALALRTELGDRSRPAGHRMLAIHLRMDGRTVGQEADHRCTCGGFLAVVTRSGDLAHLDACERCYTYGRTLPRRRSRCRSRVGHRFCGNPIPAGPAADW